MTELSKFLSRNRNSENVEIESHINTSEAASGLVKKKMEKMHQQYLWQCHNAEAQNLIHLNTDHTLRRILAIK